MKAIICILILGLSLVACQHIDTPQPPENLLPKEKIVQILADAYIGNASRSKSVNNRILRNKGVQLDSILYTKHGVDSLSFVQSNSYYASNLDTYTEIMTEVELVLSLRKKTLDSITSLDPKLKAPKKDTVSPTSFEQEKQDSLVEPVQDEE